MAKSYAFLDAHLRAQDAWATAMCSPVKIGAKLYVDIPGRYAYPYALVTAINGDEVTVQNDNDHDEVWVIKPEQVVRY